MHAFTYISAYTSLSIFLLVSDLNSNDIESIVFPEWVVEDDGCRTPDGGTGTCITIYSCKHMINLLDRVPQPIPPRITNLLKSYQCGFEGRNPKVCCPSKPIILDTVIEKRPDISTVGPPNVSRHKNIGLLPKNCGHMDLGDKIVNGNKTGLFEFPWMALLSYRTSKLCLLLFISSLYVVNL